MGDELVPRVNEPMLSKSSKKSKEFRDKIQAKDRGTWANKGEFLLSCAGYAVGLGNVWRFPYLCYKNGGGAFLIPYLLMLFLCGIPLFFMESSLGQFSSASGIAVFRIAPLFKGAGYAIIVTNALNQIYILTINSYPLIFLAHSFQSKLPWSDCNNSWNTDRCFEIARIKDSFKSNGSSFSDSNLKTPADEFFHLKMLQISKGPEDIGSIVWPIFVCNLLTWIVAYLCLIKGIKSFGKVVYFTATFPIVLLFILFVRGVTLPGAWDGIVFYLYPNWEQLTSFKTWIEAALQILYSLGPGWGGIINMASYNEFRNKNKMDSIFVPVLNCSISIFAGFAVFSVLGFMSHQTGLPISAVATQGPGLVFITYPEAISMLPLSQLWSILFFVMFFLLGLDTCFVGTEVILSSLSDTFLILRYYRKTFTLCTFCILFSISNFFVTNAGIYWITLIDWYASSIPIIIICLIEMVTISWIYGCTNFVRDIEFMTREKVHWWWYINWKYITPLLIFCLFVSSLIFYSGPRYAEFQYQSWCVVLGWLSCVASLISIPIYIVYALIKTPGSFAERIRTLLKPAQNWGPAKETHRIEFEESCAFV